jgi:hypothetical protein
MMRDISYILEQYTHPAFELLLGNAQCKDGIGRFTPHSSSPSAAVVCIAARRVHSIAFALTVSAPASSPILFSSASHFLKKALKGAVSRLEWTEVA